MLLAMYRAFLFASCVLALFSDIVLHPAPLFSTSFHQSMFIRYTAWVEHLNNTVFNSGTTTTTTNGNTTTNGQNGDTPLTDGQIRPLSGSANTAGGGNSSSDSALNKAGVSLLL